MKIMSLKQPLQKIFDDAFEFETTDVEEKIHIKEKYSYLTLCNIQCNKHPNSHNVAMDLEEIYDLSFTSFNPVSEQVYLDQVGCKLCKDLYMTHVVLEK
jgi:hypothetical protein